MKRWTAGPIDSACERYAFEAGSRNRAAFVEASTQSPAGSLPKFFGKR